MSALSPWDDFPSFVDWDAVDRTDLDYIPTSRLRAEEAYEPDPGPNTRHDPAVSEWAQLVHECARRAHRLMHGETP